MGRKIDSNEVANAGEDDQFGKGNKQGLRHGQQTPAVWDMLSLMSDVVVEIMR